jgi:hypothetical protein
VSERGLAWSRGVVGARRVVTFKSRYKQHAKLA